MYFSKKENPDDLEEPIPYEAIIMRGFNSESPLTKTYHEIVKYKVI